MISLEVVIHKGENGEEMKMLDMKSVKCETSYRKNQRKFFANMQKRFITASIVILMVICSSLSAGADEFSLMDLISEPVNQTVDESKRITIGDSLSVSIPTDWKTKSLDNSDQYYCSGDGIRNLLSVYIFSFESETSLDSWYQYYVSQGIRCSWLKINGFKMLITDDNEPYKLELMYKDQKGFIVGIRFHASSLIMESEKILTDMNSIIYSIEVADNTLESENKVTSNVNPYIDLPNTVAGGLAGSSIHWVLTNDGTLSILGSGKMDDCEWDYRNQKVIQPWEMYHDIIRAIIIEEGVNNIGECAFRECSKIEIITIPASVTDIGWCAFTGCNSLKEFVVAQNNPSFSTIDGILFDKSGKTLIKYPAEKEGSKYDVPDTVEIVMDFSYCHLKEIVFPDSVTSINGSAFSGCDDLEDIVLPKNLEVLDRYLFWSAESLRSMTIPKNVKRISQYVAPAYNTLNDIYYEGSEEDWNRIEIDPDNRELFKANIHFLANEAVSAYLR